ncbi:Non-canonical non-ribosomal peptide synthetase FUB8 [Lachnellula arida]|uniref:Non-canonical non-ribosomal peptide synthetase FUB8 n=1 Tax=Lachnellula arida TaxID=1316785 RepID=A0A8T9B6Q8_9HELO|nr:Non-canonical non-ribosomal peptide synthetase FUB8 [Lachnellula arida]
MATEHEKVAQWQNDLLLHVIDRLARERPDAHYGEWVTESSVVTITYAQLANIINGLAWWLIEQLNGPGDYSHPEVLAYIGANDVRYSALVLAAAKTGYVSPPAHVILDVVKPPRYFTAPSVEELLAKKYPPYILNKTFQDLRHTPIVVMHTSGTTGLPKPIIWTHDTCMQVLNAKGCETPVGASSVEGSLLNGKRVIVTLPPFHGALLAQLMVGAIPYGNVVIAPVAAAIPTAQGVVNALKKSPADVAILVPSVVAELAQNPELLEYCAAHLETIIYIGGDLPQNDGDRVAAKLYLRCLWGATETGIVPQLLPPELLPSTASGRSLWRYVRFPPCVGAIFDEVTDGVYELVVRHEKALAEMQPCFTVPGIDQLEQYCTKDLFERHPDVSDLWCWRARADDIIVFLNGEKTNPISMEQHIMASNPELSGVLVIGARRFQAALLIEPASESPLTIAAQATLIERVWPSVEEANRSAPAHARVEKSFILVLPAERRLIRAAKGTFMRGRSIDQYTEEIERLYNNAEVVSSDIDDSAGEIALMPTDLNGITSVVQQHICAVTGWSNLDNTENFFDRGLDSLQGLQITRALRRSFHRTDFALSTVYQNPTVSQLVAAISSQNEKGQDERETMETLLATYRGLIQQIPVSKNLAEGNNVLGQVNVILTGSTGTVGIHLLRALLDRHGIAHIFCLNRGEDGGRAMQYKNFGAAGLSTTGLDDRITFIKADLHLPSLGLDSITYESLCAQVGLIIHAAWPVNFNLALSAFRPQLAGVINLLALAASAASPPVRFTFVSSVAAVEGYIDGPAPEEILDSLDTPAPFGYARAKFLAELLIDVAARHFGDAIFTTVVRVGQVAGPVQRHGLWNPKEWFPSIVLSSLYLGKVPDSLGPRFDTIDFVPVDLLADILLDLATTTRAGEAADATTVFNLRNPCFALWLALLPAITDTAATQSLEMVSPATWLASLRKSSEVDDHDLTDRNPAIKLLDFFGGLWAVDADTTKGPQPQPMAIERAFGASLAMRKLGPVKLEWMRKWVGEWKI